jgi:hypothetical protein
MKNNSSKLENPLFGLLIEDYLEYHHNITMIQDGVV